jgi:hypothetical protein
MRNSETLKAALIRVGDEEHLAHLNQRSPKINKKGHYGFFEQQN